MRTIPIEDVYGTDTRTWHFKRNPWEQYSFFVVKEEDGTLYILTDDETGEFQDYLMESESVTAWLLLHNIHPEGFPT